MWDQPSRGISVLGFDFVERLPEPCRHLCGAPPESLGLEVD